MWCRVRWHWKSDVLSLLWCVWHFCSFTQYVQNKIDASSRNLGFLWANFLIRRYYGVYIASLTRKEYCFELGEVLRGRPISKGEVIAQYIFSSYGYVSCRYNLKNTLFILKESKNVLLKEKIRLLNSFHPLPHVIFLTVRSARLKNRQIYFGIAVSPYYSTKTECFTQ